MTADDVFFILNTVSRELSHTVKIQNVSYLYIKSDLYLLSYRSLTISVFFMGTFFTSLIDKT